MATMTRTHYYSTSALAKEVGISNEKLSDELKHKGYLSHENHGRDMTEKAISIGAIYKTLNGKMYVAFPEEFKNSELIQDLKRHVKGSTDYKLTKEDFKKISCFKDITDIHWRNFEYFTKYLLEDIGHKDIEVTKGRNDGGIDVYSIWEGKKCITQCKQWNNPKYTYKIENEIIKLSEKMKEIGAVHAILICTLDYYSKFLAFAAEKGVTLVDRAYLNLYMPRVNKDYK